MVGAKSHDTKNEAQKWSSIMVFAKDNKEVKLILNISNNCNMQCKYCYYQSEMNCNPGEMDEEILETIIKRVAESSFEKAEFIWHGGEPLTRGIDFFRNLLLLQKKHLPGIKFLNTVQTNGTLFTKEFIQLFKEHNFSIGISLDGIKDIHDEYRIYKNGKGTFHDIIKNIKVMEEAGIKYGILSVCSDKTLEYIDEYYRFFKSLKGLKGFDILIPQYSEKSQTVSPNNLSKILINLFDKWFYDKESFFEICILSSIVSKILFKLPLSCSFNENCIENSPLVSISPDGTVSPCDNLTYMDLGNIKVRSLDALIFESPTRKMYSKKEQDRLNTCLFCEWYNDCKGGCPLMTDKEGKNVYCQEYKNIFAHTKGIMEKLGILKNDSLNSSSLKNIPNPYLREKMNNIVQTIGLVK